MTSVGSGSLMIVALMLLYPTLSSKELVGTDLVQAVPLVLAAAIGHLIWGEFEARAHDLAAHRQHARRDHRRTDLVTHARHFIRPVLMLVLVLTGLKLLDVSNRPYWPSW